MKGSELGDVPFLTNATGSEGPEGSAGSQEPELGRSLTSCQAETDGVGCTVWKPLKRAPDSSQVNPLSSARRCTRVKERRNALADPEKMTMPQETRERLEEDVATRKTSLTRKMSQYFKSVYSSDYEVDLF